MDDTGIRKSAAWMMDWRRLAIVLGSREAASVLVGLAWATAFAPVRSAGVGWLVPGLLMVVGLGLRPGLALRCGYLAGLAFQLSGLRWLLNIPYPPGAVAGWLALSSVLAFFPALWMGFGAIVLGSAVVAGPDGRGDAGWQGWSGWNGMARGLVGCRWFCRLRLSVTLAAAWVAWEMVQGRVLGGFPWNFLGTSQVEVLPLIQMASVVGVAGVGFMMVWCSASAVWAVLVIVVRVGGRTVEEVLRERTPGSGCGVERKPGVLRGFAAGWGQRLWVGELALPGVMLTLVMLGGTIRILSWPAPERVVRFALVQPSIPQALIWDRAEDGPRFEKLLDLSRLALAGGADVLVWPEAAMPALGRAEYEKIFAMVASNKVWMVFGGDAPGERGEWFNAAILVGRDGRVRDVYRKRRLVMFGEYVPFSRWFPVLSRLAPIGDGFAAGTEVVPFSFEDLGVRGRPLICFEDVFGREAREEVGGLSFLLNLTNDGWFGEGAAQWQHAAAAVFRAVECGLPLVRCTNNGLTCWVDPLGRIRDAGFGPDRELYGRGFKIVEVGMRPESGRKGPGTVYARNGDAGGWVCVGVTGVVLVRRWRRASRVAGRDK